MKNSSRGSASGVRFESSVKTNLIARLKYILSLAQLSPWLVGALLGFALVSSLLSTYPATYLGRLVDNLGVLSFLTMTKGLLWYGMLLVFGSIIRNLFCMACMNFSNRLICSVRVACVEKFFQLDGRYFWDHDRGDLTNQAFNLVNKLDLIFSTSFFMLLSDWLDVLLIGWFVWRMNSWCLLIFLAGYPCLVVLIHLFNRIHARLARERLDVEQSLLARLAMLMVNRNQIWLYRTCDMETQHLRKESEALERNDFKGNSTISIYYVAERIVCVAVLVSCLLVTVVGFKKGTAKPGDMLVLVAFCDRFFSPLKNFSRYLQTLQRGLAAIDGLRQFFEQPERDNPNLASLGCNLCVQSNGVAVKLNQTNLWYPAVQLERTGLYRVSGESGCGKTTWMKSLAGLIKVPELHWTLNTTPSVGSILFLEQEAPLMSGTVLQNIRYGSQRNGPLSADEQRIVSALHLDQLLERDVGDCGDGLSTGQRQRVFLARALTSEAEMIICDETLSNMDPELRQDVGNLLCQESQRRCIVLITHVCDGLDPQKIKSELIL